MSVASDNAPRDGLGMSRWGPHRGLKGDARMPMLLSDLVLFSCLAAFIAGIAIAAASLLG
jgi:hypothetical protein